MSILTSSIDLRVAKRLKESEEFRREWYRAELEVAVPSMFRTMRERRNLNQSKLAEKAGMKQSAISRFEGSVDAKWKIETLLVLAAALDAQLTIGLEASEDVLSRVERQESIASIEKPSAAGQAAIENRNQARVEQPLGKSKAAQAAALTSPMIMSGGDRPWN